ncbi:MAG: dockerin type I repeat-containing protein, partial [Oscillospiraceae bacterium]|nr:dockerin type I repeat-containing protein [Oscillospiraceae bacterium]
TPSDVKYGDLNLDGTVALIDVIYLNKFLSGAITLNEQQKANADCVSDGALNSADAGALLQYTVEAISSLPVTP